MIGFGIAARVNQGSYYSFCPVCCFEWIAVMDYWILTRAKHGMVQVHVKHASLQRTFIFLNHSPCVCQKDILVNHL